jgi:hypothetical protein
LVLFLVHRVLLFFRFVYASFRYLLCYLRAI